MGAECSTESNSSDCGPLTDYFHSYNLIVADLNNKTTEDKQHEPSDKAKAILDRIKDGLQKKTYCIEPNAWREHPNLADIEVHFQEIMIAKECKSSKFVTTLLEIRKCITQLSCDWVRLYRRIRYIQMETSLSVQDLLKELKIEDDGSGK